MCLSFNYVFNLYDCRVQADQRAGRAGRTCPGKCYRLYPSTVYHEDFLDVTIPEIQRSSLAGTVLYLKSLDLPDIDILTFDFLDPPSRKWLVSSIYKQSLWYSQVWFSLSPTCQRMLVFHSFFLFSFLFFLTTSFFFFGKFMFLDPGLINVTSNMILY